MPSLTRSGRALGELLELPLRQRLHRVAMRLRAAPSGGFGMDAMLVGRPLRRAPAQRRAAPESIVASSTSLADI